MKSAGQRAVAVQRAVAAAAAHDLEGDLGAVGRLGGELPGGLLDEGGRGRRGAGGCAWPCGSAGCGAVLPRARRLAAARLAAALTASTEARVRESRPCVTLWRSSRPSRPTGAARSPRGRSGPSSASAASARAGRPCSSRVVTDTVAGTSSRASARCARISRSRSRQQRLARERHGHRAEAHPHARLLDDGGDREQCPVGDGHRRSRGPAPPRRPASRRRPRARGGSPPPGSAGARRSVC